MRSWYQEPAGQLLVHIESMRLGALLPNFLGETALQIEGCPDLGHLVHSPMTQQVQFLSTNDPACAVPSTLVDLTELPLVPNGVDLAVVPHVLEFTDSPRQLLSQLYQALAPHGHVVLLTFAPMGLWGVARWLHHRHGIPWSGQFWPQAKLRYWLEAIGLTIVKSQSLCFHWPSQQPSMRRAMMCEAIGRVCYPPFGSVNLIIAQKQINAFTPIKASWWAKKAPAIAAQYMFDGK